MNIHHSPNSINSEIVGSDLAGSIPIFPGPPGDDLTTGLSLPDFRQKRLLFNRIQQPGQVHVYSTECRAGQRLRIQMYVPVLPMGDAVTPAFAAIAQSLPYSADMQKLPVDLPAGYSAVVAPPPGDLQISVRDMLTRASYYPGPSIDTRTLVGGRCYVVVWSPENAVGRYVLQIGHRWPLRWTYWAQLPLFWWQIRGWFGMDRSAAYVAGGTLFGAALWMILRHKLGQHRSIQDISLQQNEHNAV